MADVIAIVPSAGLGRRFSKSAKKPFASITGRPVLVWTLQALAASEQITEIIPALRPEDMDAAKGLISQYKIEKIKRIAPGGAERQDSVYNALDLIGGDFNGIVLVHDGVRPLVTQRLIKESIDVLDAGFDGAIAAVPPKDTIKEAGEDGVVKKTLYRQALWSVQTPQTFRFKTLFSAYKAAMKDGASATDDAALVERAGGRVKIIMGDYENIKITTPSDVEIAEAFMRRRAKQ